MQSFWQWLIGEAGAGWIIGILGLALFIISELRKRTGQRIIFAETSLSSLVRISREMREKIAVTFEDKPVDCLSQLEAELFNSGSEVITDAILKLQIPNAREILGVSIEGEFGTQSCQAEVVDSEVTLRIPYLNPVKPHDHRVRLALIIDGAFSGLHVTGSGEGWSLRHDWSATSLRALGRTVQAVFGMIFIFVLGSMTVGAFELIRGKPVPPELKTGFYVLWVLALVAIFIARGIGRTFLEGLSTTFEVLKFILFERRDKYPDEVEPRVYTDR